MNQSAYIGQLMKAEQSATNIIEMAQKQRQRKLKEARQAAQLQVNKFRLLKEQELQRMQQRKEDKEIDYAIKKQTAQELKKIEQEFKLNKDKVVKMLVQKILTVDLKISDAVKQKFSLKNHKK